MPKPFADARRPHQAEGFPKEFGGSGDIVPE
jgi:hypothetical protein